MTTIMTVLVSTLWGAIVGVMLKDIVWGVTIASAVLATITIVRP